MLLYGKLLLGKFMRCDPPKVKKQIPQIALEDSLPNYT